MKKKSRDKRITTPLKTHGGKHYIATRIVEMMPSHEHYVEPYAGGLSVLLAKEQNGSELVNDINGKLTNFWRVLQNETHFTKFRRIVNAVPFSEKEWKDAGEPAKKDPVSLAVSFFIRCRQSMAGRMKGFAPISRTRTRRDMNEQASAWISTIEGLPEVYKRLQGVVILENEATKVIRQQDGKKTLFYVDAPYVHATRTSTDVYEHEMTDEQHKTLVGVLRSIKGKAIVSMYRHEIYDALHLEHGWNLTEIGIANHASGGSSKRRMVECLWTNFNV